MNFKVAEDNKGKKLRIPLKYFLEYLIYNKDDSPLYLFERFFIKFIYLNSYSKKIILYLAR